MIHRSLTFTVSLLKLGWRRLNLSHFVQTTKQQQQQNSLFDWFFSRSLGSFCLEHSRLLLASSNLTKIFAPSVVPSGSNLLGSGLFPVWKVGVAILRRISALHKDSAAGLWRWLNPSIPPVLSPLEPGSEAGFILQIAGYPGGPRPWRSRLRGWSGVSAASSSKTSRGFELETVQPADWIARLASSPTLLVRHFLTGIDRADGQIIIWGKLVFFFCFFFLFFCCCVARSPAAPWDSCSAGLRSSGCATWGDLPNVSQKTE